MADTVFTLPPELTIYTVGELYPACLAWLGDADGPSQPGLAPLAADAVAEVDAAGVQLLLSLHNALAQRQRQLRLVSPSAPLLAACAALGATCLAPDSNLQGAAA